MNGSEKEESKKSKTDLTVLKPSSLTQLNWRRKLRIKNGETHV